jgi:hypothetical protein
MEERTRVLICMVMSRVGSTFLRRILADHPDIYITNETRLYYPRPWVQYFHAAMVKIDSYPIEKGKGLAALEQAYWSVEGQFRDVERRHRSIEASVTCIRAIEDALLGGYQVIGDKGYNAGLLTQPLVGGIAEALNLRAIFLYRDPRDTFTSLGRNKKSYPYNILWAEDPRRHSITWVRNFRAWEKAKESKPMPLLEVKYERLMEDYKGVIREIAQFVGVHAGPMIKSFRKHVAKRDHLGYWKELYPDMESELHPDIFPIMERLGYR